VELPPKSIGAKLLKLGGRIDLRVLLVGSMLPDIIDKPLGQIILRHSVNSGRILGHILSFLLIITLVGLYLYHSRNRLWMLILSLGTFVHLILDEMWLEPQTLLWPLYGWTFPRFDLTISEWTQGMLRALFSDPAVYVSEAIGLTVLIWFGVTLLRRGAFRTFLRQGRMYN